MAAAVDAEFAAHMAAVEGQTDAIIAGCFTLLPRLAEIESMVREARPDHRNLPSRSSAH